MHISRAGLTPPYLREAGDDAVLAHSGPQRHHRGPHPSRESCGPNRGKRVRELRKSLGTPPKLMPNVAVALKTGPTLLLCQECQDARGHLSNLQAVCVGARGRVPGLPPGLGVEET